MLSPKTEAASWAPSSGSVCFVVAIKAELGTCVYVAPEWIEGDELRFSTQSTVLSGEKRIPALLVENLGCLQPGLASD